MQVPLCSLSRGARRCPTAVTVLTAPPPPHAHPEGSQAGGAPPSSAAPRAGACPPSGAAAPPSHAGRRGADRPSSHRPLLPAAARPRAHRAPRPRSIARPAPPPAPASSPTWCRPPPRARPDRRPMRSRRRLADGTRRACPLVGTERPGAPSANGDGGRSATCGRPMGREEGNAGINPVLPGADRAPHRRDSARTQVWVRVCAHQRPSVTHTALRPVTARTAGLQLAGTAPHPPTPQPEVRGGTGAQAPPKAPNPPPSQTE